MSGHNWKPGDVANIDGEFYLRTGNGWLFASKGGGWSHAEGFSAERVTQLARPLVVIDPEDREQVKRLDDLLWATNTAGEATNDLQAALREFAASTPPKPDEPQGLGAVVEDAEGAKWVRHEHDPGRGDRSHAWYPAGFVHNRPRVKYDTINAVRVLSEGVQ